MPLYDYACEDCGHVDEVSRRMSERNSPMECGQCGGQMKLAFTKTEFLLRGGGWSGTAHPIIHAPDQPSNYKPVPTNYYNCTPESVHKT